MLVFSVSLVNLLDLFCPLVHSEVTLMEALYTQLIAQAAKCIHTKRHVSGVWCNVDVLTP